MVSEGTQETLEDLVEEFGEPPLWDAIEPYLEAWEDQEGQRIKKVLGSLDRRGDGMCPSLGQM